MNKYTILYAEDEIEVRKSYIPILKNYFNKVYEANDGEEAYHLYKKNNPDILIIDINMPILNGLELAEKIRKKDRNIIIIVLSALGDQNTLLKACEVYLLKYLLKPVKTIQLKNVLEYAIDELNKKRPKINFINITQNIKLDKESLAIYDNKEQIQLTKKEKNLIRLLSRNQKQTFTNEDILNHVWEDEIFKDSDFNKLRVLIYRLNKKFSTDIIVSSYNLGYSLLNNK
jgi:DNA-binding response OmpR family regulator